MNNKQPKKALIFLGGALMGLMIFLIIYGFDPVNFTNDSYIINGYIEKDVAQHYAGWMLYRQSPWQFPLGAGSQLAYPYGSSVSYTDSIPLFAIFFKALSPILPQTFQYFGLFVLLCFMLQGGFGALLSGLFTKSRVLGIAAGAVFVFSPIMIERAFRHCGLTAHFLIVAALYYYFKNKGSADFKAVLPFFIINALSITIHPYFMPFTFGIMFAFCLENFFLKKKYLQNVLYLLASVALTLFVGYVIGAFYVRGNFSAIGYGYFNMNLNALYNPVSKGFDNWSAILEIKPNVLGEIEGFNYLGLGIIAFIPSGIIALLARYKTKIFKTAMEFIKNNFGIIFSATSLLLFAIGDWVRFGGLALFRLPFPAKFVNGIFGIFRANGRFGNIIVYLLVIFVLYSILSLKNQRLSTALLIVLMGLQIFDMRYALQSKYNYFHSKTENLQNQPCANTLKNDFWDQMVTKYDNIYILGNMLGGGNIDLTVKAAKQGKNINSTFEARIDDEKYSQLAKEIKNSIVENNVFPESTVILEDDITDYKQLCADKEIYIFMVDGQFIICDYDDFLPSQAEAFAESENFMVLDENSYYFTLDYYLSLA